MRPTFEEHIAGKRKAKRTSATYTAPFHEQRNAAASWLAPNVVNLDKELYFIMHGSEAPNKEQESFLRHFVLRLKVELREMSQRSTEQSLEEPLLDLIHGFPGTGKSKIIQWMRRLMEAGLGWQHGVQYVCLAFQNAMAAQINGFTIHHWSGIPARAVDGGSSGDKHKQANKCQALRVIIIDEISMVAAELLGGLVWPLKEL